MNTLRQAVHEYLGMRRHLGFKLRKAGKALLDFATFMEQRHAPYITQSLALSWARQPTNVLPSCWGQRLSFVRCFARYRSSSDPRTQIPATGLLPFQPKRARPYLYSDEEIISLLRTALNMPHHYKSGALLPRVYYCLFRGDRSSPAGAVFASWAGLVSICLLSIHTHVAAALPKGGAPSRYKCVRRME